MKNILCYLLLQFIACIAMGQSNNFAIYDSALVQFERNNPQEKVFVQTDKEYYYAGETIWMKAWCVLNNYPTYLSRILYIDLTDANGKVVLKKMYKLDSLSSTAADFKLPEILPTGTYSLNSYTLWMKNFYQSGFSKNISVYGLLVDSANNDRVKNTPKPVLKFFPEGGNLVAGVSNRVAFKATNSNNLPQNFEGYITDETDKKIAGISSIHDGMGFFEFTPQSAKAYTAYIIQSSSVSYSYPLPVVLPAGVALKIENSNPNKIFALVTRGMQGPSNVSIIAQINNTIIFRAKLDLAKGESAVAINKKDLPGGIMQITIFDENNLPVAERIAFVENYELEKPSLTSSTISTNKKGLNVLNIILPDNKEQSVSCLITSYIPGINKNDTVENIASAVFLTSDVKGYIHNPGYYFKDKSAETLEHLDLLLMTHGWRRFEWKEILKGEAPSIKYPVETSITYSGRVFKTGSDKNIVDDGFVSFIFGKKSKNEILANAKINKNGDFYLTDINFNDTTSLSYMGTNNKKKKYVAKVVLHPNYIDTLQYSASIPKTSLNTELIYGKDPFATEWAKNAEIRSKVLERVIVKGTRYKEDILNEKYATGEFKKKRGIIIDPTDFRKGKQMADMVQVSVPGISVYRSENFFEPVMIYGRGGAMQYSVNGRVVKQEDIYNIDEDQIGMIKFFGSVLFDDPFDMIPTIRPHLAIYTKDKERPFIPVHEKRYITQEVLGYSISKKFYEPDSKIKPEAKNIDDNRFTLYWNGNVKPATDGSYRVKFYNNAIGNKYKVIIQGITKEGKVIYLNQII